MLARCLRLQHPKIPTNKKAIPWRTKKQQFSSSPMSSMTHSNVESPLLGALTTELDKLAPRIDIRADQIDVLESPAQFYECLKQKIGKAKRRIYLSTLYIGKTESELITVLRDALLKSGLSLQVSILTDALRGTREDPEASCASLLASLIVEFPDQVQVHMYHTPNLTGLRKKYIPRRINEGWGLQHMKIYGIDDEVILSGANLSNDYFTNRQDRYHVFSSKRVTEHFLNVHKAVCSASFHLKPGNQGKSHQLTWPSSNSAPNPLTDPSGHSTAITYSLNPLTSPSRPSSLTTTNTTVYPLLSHPPAINTELPVLRTLLSFPLSSYIFTAGYFNPHPLVTSCLIARSSSFTPCPGTILTASPFANGFHNSAGVSGLLPAAYTHLSLRFLQAAQGARISLREWKRGVVGQPDGWTYHAKGLWTTFPTDSKAFTQPPGPSATVIGSSNYTTRSYSLDLEVGALVVTSDHDLMRKWRREEEGLLRYTTEVKEQDLKVKERRAGWKVKAAMWIVKAVGGAL
ncbi:MAG: hypothetical protein LQ351_003714 [Letrouitia transgressa]|nr:MAG: hypothetical protein LQ351_003714 [Letrouitia transgressa]